MLNCADHAITYLSSRHDTWDHACFSVCYQKFSVNFSYDCTTKWRIIKFRNDKKFCTL